jgi:hypothetical protein
MSKQPEALRLAFALESHDPVLCERKAAAELRHLHSVNADLLQALRRSVAAFEGDHIDEIEADYGLATAQRVHVAREAIAKATGEQQ